jgi:DNA-binding NarL/FixJ family response regulator
MSKLRYDTVREVLYAPSDLELLSDWLQSQGLACHVGHLISSGPDPARLAQVKDVIETVITGRKHDVLMLRAQGRTLADIALLLSISKSAVQSHHRLAVRRVRQALGVDPVPVSPGDGGAVATTA